MLASKGTENLLIEVKGSGSRIDPEIYLSVDREVQRHPGWKFLLVIVSDEEWQELAPNASNPVDLSATPRSLARPRSEYLPHAYVEVFAIRSPETQRTLASC